VTAGLTIPRFSLSEAELLQDHWPNKERIGANCCENGLVISLDGTWRTATDQSNVGREQKWFLALRQDAKSTPVPSIIQEAFPGYHGVVWYWREFETPPILMPAVDIYSVLMPWIIWQMSG